MLRMFRCVHFLTKSQLVTPQGDISSFLSLNRLYTPSIKVAHFCAGNPAEKAVKNSKETEAVDLDKWKSVMTSQAKFQVQRLGDEAEPSEDVDRLKPTGGDPNGGSSLEAMRDMVLMWREAGKLVPQQLTDEELRTLADLTTKSSKKRYLKILAIRENHRLKCIKKREQKAAEKEAALMEKKKTESEEENEHGLKAMNNLFFQKYWKSSLDRLYRWRAANAMVFGQPLIFDMSHESNMNQRELKNAVSQLMMMEAVNRSSVDPFHLHYCGLQPGGAYERELQRQYGAQGWERLLVTSTEQQHVDLFPREQLVYLTADSPHVLHAFDSSKVYIVGALVDLSGQSGLSLANAKRLNLSTARLPLDEYLQWELGNKNMTLDQMIKIMLSIKDTGSWKEALEFVPKRKHGGFYQRQTESEAIVSQAPGDDRHEMTFKNQDGGWKNTKTTSVRAAFITNRRNRKWCQDD